MSFNDFNLHPSIKAEVDRLGYETATPIQEKGIPPAMEGHDLLGLAQTGTGKTAAFVIPILQNLIEKKAKRKPRALILAPTRELTEQTYDSFRDLGRRTKLKFITIYGGVKQNPQVEKLDRGVDVVIACPGRLLDLLNQRVIDLSKVEILVLDEADRMFDMGFMPDVRKIAKQIPRERQTMLFSATMPDDIRKLSHEILKNPVTVQIAHTMPLETVSHALYPVPQHLKTGMLKSLLRTLDTESVLVFTKTRHKAKRLASNLEHLGYKATSLQGNLTQNQRQAALNGFKSGKFQILVATDIAARGIDVSNISHVINYDIPATADDYTHRIGRTGRAAKTGDAFTFVTKDDGHIVKSIEKVMGSKIERRTIEGFDYDQPIPPKPDRPNRPPRSRARSGKPNSGKHHSNKPRSGGGGKHHSNKPRGDRPHSDRPHSDRSYSDKPRGDRQHSDRSYSDKPRGDRPHSDRSHSDKPRGDRHHSGKPRGDRPHSDRSHSDKSYSDKPRGDRHHSGKPRGDRPHSDRSHSDKPYSDKPRGDRHHSGKPRGDRPHSDRSHSDKPYSGKPKGDRHHSGGHHSNKPHTGKPKGDKRYSSKKYADHSNSNNPRPSKPGSGSSSPNPGRGPSNNKSHHHGQHSKKNDYHKSNNTRKNN